MDLAQLDSAGFSQVVECLGGAEALAASAKELEAFVRARDVRSAVDLLRLVLMYGPGGHSLRSLAAVAAVQDIADVTDVALLKRFKKCADWLKSLCEQRLGRLPALAAARGSERPIRIVDGSRLEGPGESVWR